MTARMPESEAHDFLSCLSRCYVAAFQRGDRATADRIREGMEEFERLRRVEPVDHLYVCEGGPSCAKCGRTRDEHLEFALRLSLVEGRSLTAAGERT